MIVIENKKENYDGIIDILSNAILEYKVIAVPTDTSYALCALAANVEALDRLYAIKGRSFNKPVHVFPSSPKEITDIAVLGNHAKKIGKAFWPGPLTLVLPLLKPRDSNVKSKHAWQCINRLAASTGYLGFREPKHKVPYDITETINGSITATSANVSGLPDCYSGDEIIAQYKNRKLKPDILLHVDRLPKRKPSTVVKFELDGTYAILRHGPISKKQIERTLSN